MNPSHRKTLNAVFANRSPRSLPWERIEALFLALGARKVEGKGSRVHFELNGVLASFHRPHPMKETKPYQVRDARKLLQRAGIEP